MGLLGFLSNEYVQDAIELRHLLWRKIAETEVRHQKELQPLCRPISDIDIWIKNYPNFKTSTIWFIGTFKKQASGNMLAQSRTSFKTLGT